MQTLLIFLHGILVCNLTLSPSTHKKTFFCYPVYPKPRLSLHTDSPRWSFCTVDAPYSRSIETQQAAAFKASFWDTKWWCWYLHCHSCWWLSVVLVLQSFYQHWVRSCSLSTSFIFFAYCFFFVLYLIIIIKYYDLLHFVFSTPAPCAPSNAVSYLLFKFK